MSGLPWPRSYEFRLEGTLDGNAACWFDGLHLETDGQHTVLSGELLDQSALHGVLLRVRDLGLGLLSVRLLE